MQTRIGQNAFSLLEVPFFYVDAVCRCGRENGPVPHCRNCGSTNGYGVSAADEFIPLVYYNPDESLFVPMSEEDKKKGVAACALMVAKGFRCRRCKTYFSEASRCKAPVLVVKEATTHLTAREKANAKRSEDFLAKYPRAKTFDERLELTKLAYELNMTGSLPPGKQRILDYYRGVVPSKAEAPVEQTSEAPSASDVVIRKMFAPAASESQQSNGETAATAAPADAAAPVDADAPADKTNSDSDYKDNFDWSNNKL